MTSEQPISQPQRIDRFVGQYAERAVGMVASEIRALFAVAARPEIVSLAGGSPYVSALPLDAVGEMVGQLVTAHGATAAVRAASGQRAAKFASSVTITFVRSIIKTPAVS